MLQESHAVRDVPHRSNRRRAGSRLDDDPQCDRRDAGHGPDGYGNEPTRGLDLPAKHEMWSLLLDLAAREQVTTFSAAVRRWRSEASAVRSA